MADDIHEYSDNIISRLLLTGEIRGTIYQPYFYFQNSSDSIREFLDLVMLTNGWRRFNWELLSKGKTPEIKYKDNQHIQIMAELNGISPQKISRKESINIFLQLKDSSKFFFQLPFVSDNKFQLKKELIFFDTASIGYSFNHTNGILSKGTVYFNNGLLPGSDKIQPWQNPNYNYDQFDSSFLERNKYILEENQRYTFSNQHIKTLNPVIIKGRKSKEQILDEKYASGAFAFHANYSFDVENDTFSETYNDALDYIKAKIGGLIIHIDPSSGRPYLIWHGAFLNCYLDGLSIDALLLKSVPISNIAYIKMYDEVEANILPKNFTATTIDGKNTKDSATIFNMGSPGGALAVFTKRGDDFVNDPRDSKEFMKTRVAGYTPVKEFYNPDYSVQNDLNKSLDTRTTIFWRPYILTDKNHQQATIQFYNNDITHVMRLVLEGIDEEGKLIRMERIIQ